jgi:DNA replication protein DnaC
MVSRAHVTALASGDGWIDRGGTILLFGPSGSGKSHLGAALGHAHVLTTAGTQSWFSVRC